MKKRMRQSIVCLTCICLVLTGCSSGTSSTSPAEPTTESPATTEPANTTDTTDTTDSSDTTAETSSDDVEATTPIDMHGIGNSPGNNINSGLLASKDGWIYYNSSPFSEKNESALYKAKIDGSEKTKLSQDSPYFINVVEDWIFYINASDDHTLYRIKNDGTSREKLTEKAVWSMMVIDNWIYYAQQYSPPKFKKMQVDGSSTTVIGTDEPELMGISNEWIYYLNGDDECVYKIKTDGSGRQQLTEGETSYFTVEGDWLYYILDDDNSLNRIKTDGSSKATLAKSFKGGLPLVQGDRLYYLYGGAINSMKLDGTDTVQVFKYSVRTLNYADGWFYYSNGADEKFYRVKVDGSKKELFGQ